MNNESSTNRSRKSLVGVALASGLLFHYYSEEQGLIQLTNGLSTAVFFLSGVVLLVTIFYQLRSK